MQNGDAVVFLSAQTGEPRRKGSKERVANFSARRRVYTRHGHVVRDRDQSLHARVRCRSMGNSTHASIRCHLSKKKGSEKHVYIYEFIFRLLTYIN